MLQEFGAKGEDTFCPDLTQSQTAEGCLRRMSPWT